jgi:hypothetical protein
MDESEKGTAQESELLFVAGHSFLLEAGPDGLQKRRQRLR